MRVTLKQILENGKLDSCKIYGSEELKDKVVTEVSYGVEDMNYAELLGGEVLILLQVNSMTELRKILRQCQEYHAAGIVMKEQQIRKEWQEEMRQVTDYFQMPVVAFPQEINIRLFEKNANEYIFRMKNPEIIEESFIGELLFREDKEKMLASVEQMEGFGLNPFSAYQVAILKVNYKNYNLEKKETTEYIYQALLRQLKQDKWHCYAMHYAHSMIFLMDVSPSDVNGQENYALLKKCIKLMRKRYPDVRFRAAMGRSYQPITSVKESFDEALFILNMFSTLAQNHKDELISYYDIGFYQILRASYNTEQFLQFYRERIGVLEEYDKMNGTDLTESLWGYLANSCNFNLASKAMYVHINTLRYRLNKIEELMHIDLKDMHQLLQLYICYYIKNYMNITVDDHIKS
jgi:sugar diacid utilization regulator